MTNENYKENHLRALFQLLGLKGHYIRVGSLDYSTKKFEQIFAKDEEEVIVYFRSHNGKRNCFIGRAPRDSSGTPIGTAVVSFDLDPIRPKDTASSDEQHLQALAAGKRILEQYPGGYLASSGNGALLLYRIPFVGSDGLEEHYKKEAVLIEELQKIVGEGIKIDSTNYDEAVIKALGTMSTKGATEQRRCSMFIDWPYIPYRTPTRLIDKLASIQNVSRESRSSDLRGNPVQRLTDAEKFLKQISKDKADEYESWLKVGMALKEFGVAGLTLWKEWSKQSEKYEEGSCEKKFDSFDSNPSVTVSSLAYWAKQDSGNSPARQVEPTRAESPSNVLESFSVEEFLKDAKPIEWIVPNILGKGTIAFVAGLPETKKTWLVIDLAIQAARGGGKWAGMFPTCGAKVLLIDQERFKNETQRRLKSMLANYGLTSMPNLEIMCGTTVRLDLDHSFEAFKRKMREIKPGLVIVDSFATFHLKEENNRKDIQIVLERIKALRQEFACTFVFIDHEGKSVLNVEEAGAAPDPYKMVGSISKPAAAETVLTVRKNEDGSSTVYHTKSTLAPTVGEFKFRVTDTDKGIKVEVVK